MQLNDIEMSIAVGRTALGSTITVRDIMKTLAKVTGAGLGSQQFDQILADPQLMHAPDMVANAKRYALLCSLLDGNVPAPEEVEIQAMAPAEEASAVQLRIAIPTHSDQSMHLNTLLDNVLTANQNRKQA